MPLTQKILMFCKEFNKIYIKLAAYRKKMKMEMRGIDPRTSHMLSERSTI